MAKKSKPTKKPSPDKLAKSGKKGDIELKEDELKQVTGGGATVFKY